MHRAIGNSGIMEINVKAGDVTTIETSALVVNLFQGVTGPEGATGVPARTLVNLAMNLAAE